MHALISMEGVSFNASEKSVYVYNVDANLSICML